MTTLEPATRRGIPISTRLIRFLAEPFRILWRHRRLLVRTGWNEIRGRYAGSVLGLLWLVLFPLLFLGTYAAVYLLVYKVRFNLGNSTDYTVFIFCGLIPFIGFSEALASGTPSVTSNAALIKNTLFPIELIPVRAVLISQCTQLVGTVMLFVAVAAVGRLTPWACLWPAIWLMQVLFSIGLIWILSSLNVYFRDLQTTIGLLTLLLMMISPIGWSVDMVPAELRPIMGLNPLYYVIISYQEALMGARTQVVDGHQLVVGGHFPRNGVFWGLLALGVGTFYVGFWFFRRMKRLFADNV